MSFQLPAPGDIQGQIQAGQNLAQQIEQASGPDGDPSALLGEGIAIAGTAVGGTEGIALSTIGGELAGFAMAGPVGAAIAFLGSYVAVLSSYVKSSDTAVAYGVSKATETISARIAGFGKPVGSGPNIGAPGGWSAADWSAFARPPSTTNNPSKAAAINANGRQYLWNSVAGKSLKPGIATGNQLHQWISSQKPICTPIWFYWSDPNKIVDCDSDLYFGKGGAGGSVGTLKNRWIQGTTSTAGMTQSQIVDAAIPRLPDPLYWAADLYGTIGPGNMFGSGYSTVYVNVDLLNAMATVLTMLSMGASIRAVLSELLIQSYILSVQGSQDTSGGKIANAGMNQYGFHQLVDDYIRMAQAQQTATSTDLSTGAKIGAVLAGATGAILVGILGYSAVTKTSPVQTTRLALARAGQLRRRF
jgi:hypothetical protein